MKSKKIGKDLEDHINKAVSKIDKYLHDLIAIHPKKTELISYWMHDFTRMIDFEDKFKPTKNKRYKKGDVIKVNLGFNIGSEQGGLHYAVVLEKNNSQASPVITVAPLTSIDSSGNSNKGFRPGELNLGDELFQMLNKKCQSEIDRCNSCIEKIDGAYKTNPQNYKDIKRTFEEFSHHKKDVEKTLDEIRKMKTGSICMINQITTISKIRIYDPKTTRDVLHGIRFSDETLDLIDENIKKFFFKY